MDTNFSTACNDTDSDLCITVNNTEDEYIESYRITVKIAFVIFACVSLVFSLVAIIFMRRARRIPYATKFLSTGLLLFDTLFIVLSTIRKFIVNPVISYTLQTMGAVLLQLTVFTICLMSIERYYVICKPMVYVSVVNRKNIKKMVIFAWTCNISLCILMRYAVCLFFVNSMSIFTTAGTCNGIMSVYYGTLVLTCLSIACVCYVNIYRSIKKVIASVSQTIREDRSTHLSFFYLIVIIASALAYLTIILLVLTKNLEQTRLRLAMDSVSFFNCIFDPILYVFWFKECRLQFLKFLALFSKTYEQRAEVLRMKIYDIVTIQQRAAK